jgi:hypothetical protein
VDETGKDSVGVLELEVSSRSAQFSNRMQGIQFHCRQTLRCRYKIRTGGELVFGDQEAFSIVWEVASRYEF